MPADPHSTHHVDELLRTLGERVRHGDLARLIRCGPFTLLHPIGRGGIASVYAAVRDGDSSPRHAVKVFDRGVDAEEMLARFEREHRIISGIGHRSVITVVDSGIQETGQPWFAMPRVDGSAVTREADRIKLGMPERLHLAQLACEGIAAAHAAGVIHRDIKPGNVIAAWRSPSPEVKLIDFGLARALGASERRITPAGAVRRMGTPEYMAPEQWSDGIAACDARADVFALGILIAELCTGVIARRRTPPSADARSGRRGSGRHVRIAPATPCAPSEALDERIRSDPAAAEELAQLRGIRSAMALLRVTRDAIDPLVAPMLRQDAVERPADASVALPMVAAAQRQV